MPKKSSTNKPSWSTPDLIKAHLRNKWDKGAFLNADDSNLFPLQLSLKKPSANEITESFALVQNWISEFEALSESKCVQVIWEERNHRWSGRNRFPVKIHIPSATDLATFVNRSSEWKKWNTALESIHTRIPELLPYWQQQARKSLGLALDLPKLDKLLSVCLWCRSYIQEKQTPIYIRQIPLEGIHTKFVEANKSVMAAWLDFLCPESLVNREFSKGSEFAKRYGFLDKPQQVRIRILDPNLFLQGLSDLTLVPQELANLEIAAQHVFVCENNVTSLSFPAVRDSILIFGGGYGFEALTQIPWLHSKQILYWGDLDTNGFCILDQLKAHFPHTQSFLMDEKTLLDHREFWSREDRPSYRTLSNLHEAENNVYQGLCSQAWGENIRLEQELISINLVTKVLSEMGFRLTM